MKKIVLFLAVIMLTGCAAKYPYPYTMTLGGGFNFDPKIGEPLEPQEEAKSTGARLKARPVTDQDAIIVVGLALVSDESGDANMGMPVSRWENLDLPHLPEFTPIDNPGYLHPKARFFWMGDQPFAAYRVKPGTYRHFVSAYKMRPLYKNEGPNSLIFKIENGETLYIGTLLYLWENNRWGKVKYKILVKDDFDKAKEFIDKQTELKDRTLTKRLIKRKNIENFTFFNNRWNYQYQQEMNQRINTINTMQTIQQYSK